MAISRTKRIFRAAVGVPLAILVLHVAWHRFTAVDHERLLSHEPEFAQDLGDQVANRVRAGVDSTSFHTGSEFFDGEWKLVTAMMSAVGLSQIVFEHPELLPRYQDAFGVLATVLADPNGLRFVETKWPQQGLARLDDDAGHAYLGYVNYGLGWLRRVDPDFKEVALHDRLSAALSRRLATSPYGLIETYPGETYPPDVAVVLASVGLHGCSSGVGHTDTLRRATGFFRSHYIEPQTGYLAMNANAATGDRGKFARGSATALAAAVLVHADQALAAELAATLAGPGRRSFLGFGAVHEAGAVPHGGDIDSGPVIMGVSISASGFALGSYLTFGHTQAFAEGYRTAGVFGAPVTTSGGRGYLTGGAIGNAILLAMTTAPKLSEIASRRGCVKQASLPQSLERAYRDRRGIAESFRPDPSTEHRR